MNEVISIPSGGRRALTALALCLLACLSCGRQRPWNVVLFTFDTTRADFLGPYGKQNAHTPHLNRLAAEGFLFENNYTSNPVTQAAHSTILTGVYPMVHGVRDNTFFHLPDQQETLAELLSAAGYRTAAAIGGFPLTREFGTAQGFDLFDDDLTADRRDHRGRPVQRSRRTWYDERPAGHVNDAILPWIRETAGQEDSPFFVWLHYWDPHEPHIAPEPYSQLFAHEPYSGEIAYADESLGTILRELEALGELQRTLVVMTADHGEGRLEHREMTHAFLAYDSTLHVPLIVRVPGRRGGVRIAQRTGTVDIVPTVLDLLGLGSRDHFQGRSLAPLMAQGAASRARTEDRRVYYSESLSPRLSHGMGELRVLFGGPFKYIYGPRPELFDLASDPQELHDLSALQPERAEEMRLYLQRFVADKASSAAESAVHDASEEARRQLEALGYLSTSGKGPEAIVEALRSDGAAPQDHVGDINLAQRLRNNLGLGRFRTAREIAETLLATSPGHEFYRAKWVAAQLGLGALEEAARSVEATETTSSVNFDDYLEVAIALVDDGLRERGIAMARHLVDARETAAGRFALAELYRDLGDRVEGSANLDRALELDPNLLPARLARAELVLEAGGLDEAEEKLRSILREYPGFAAAHLSYGRLLAASGRQEAAIERLTRALTLGPGLCEAHLGRLELLVDRGRRGRALDALRAMRSGCRDREMVAQAASRLDDGDGR